MNTNQALKVINTILFVVACVLFYSILTHHTTLRTHATEALLFQTMLVVWFHHNRVWSKPISKTTTVVREIEECEVPEFILAQMRRNMVESEARAARDTVVLPPSPAHYDSPVL